MNRPEQKPTRAKEKKGGGNEREGGAEEIGELCKGVQEVQQDDAGVKC